jgi:DNA invertase Pin-like site-specific DNA recombinase
MASGKFVAYYRVSTNKQGKSGLGLEAQQKAVSDFLDVGSWSLISHHVEIESGKRNDRPRLKEAIAACRKYKAKLVIAKLDRLARNAAFLLTLRDSGVDFVAADMPQADKLTVSIMAVFAEHERDMIARRTKEALAAAKARGVRLGSPDPLLGSAAGAVSNRFRAAQFASNVLPIVREIQNAGMTTLRDIAQVLNARGIPTARGGTWAPQTVANLLKRQHRSGPL